jgi:hypothetical protein
MTPFRWKNCLADVLASKHNLTIKSFLDNVVQPSIQFLEDKIAELGRSEDETAIFEISDMQEVLRETKLAFCLSVQSIWERQFRSYLRGCARDLQPGRNLAEQVEKANWENLCALFQELRGIRLSEFPSYRELETLHLLGNACRHGDGTSAIQLLERAPELWPTFPPMPPEFQTHPRSLPSVAMIDIPVARINSLVDAVVNFWLDTEYIYNESIERKHPRLEARLILERAERTWRPQTSTDS